MKKLWAVLLVTVLLSGCGLGKLTNKVFHKANKKMGDLILPEYIELIKTSKLKKRSKEIRTASAQRCFPGSSHCAASGLRRTVHRH